MQLYIRTVIAKTIVIDAEPRESIKDLKKKIQYREGIPSSQQHLYWDNRHLEDDHTLQHYDIKSDSFLRLNVDLEIIVCTLTNDISSTFFLPQTEAIEGLKKRIEDRHGIPPDQMRIMYAGQQLQDNRTLADYFISNDSKLYVILRLRGC